MSKVEIKETVVGENVGKRLDRFVVELLQSNDLVPKEYSEFFSRSQVVTSLADFVSVAERTLKPGYKLRENDVVTIVPEAFVATLERLAQDREKLDRIIPQVGEFEIVHEDKDFMVIKKDHGVVIHPGIGNVDGTLANWVKYYLQDKGEYDQQLERAGIVHRLDKGVGGLLVVAKHIKAQKALKKLFEEHKVVKIYHASVRKLWNTPEGEIFKSAGENPLDLKEEMDLLKEHDFNAEEAGWLRVGGYIKRDSIGRRRMVLGEEGKEALTYIRALNTGTCLVKIETGRMHQIRATLKSMGYVIQGDQMYGDRSSRDSNYIKLDSILLSFELFEKPYTFVV